MVKRWECFEERIFVQGAAEEEKKMIETRLSTRDKDNNLIIVA